MLQDHRREIVAGGVGSIEKSWYGLPECEASIAMCSRRCRQLGVALADGEGTHVDCIGRNRCGEQSSTFALHGEDIAPLHVALKTAPQYTKCLAIGVAIGQAYSAESKAPPFGLYVDMTARSTASYNDSPYLSSFDRWWTGSGQEEIDASFGPALRDHFAYLESKCPELEYPLNRLQEHRELATEYFRFKTPAD